MRLDTAWILEREDRHRQQGTVSRVGGRIVAKALSPWPNKKHAFVSYGRFERGLSGILPMREVGNGTTFNGNPAGYFEYVVFYDENSTLRQMAESAVCIGIQTTSFYLSADRTYIKPTSHRLDYLAERKKAFENRR